MLRENLILKADSYSGSHHLMYPSDTCGMFSYVESRGGRWPSALWAGLQPTIEMLMRPVTYEDVDEAESFMSQHGVPFPTAMWSRVADLGYLPVRIRALPEGVVVPNGTPLMTVESTDPQTYGVVSWLEALLLRAVWYPVAVATQSFYCKRVIRDALVESSDDPAAELPFKLHDFGARGVSSGESAAIGGCAHLFNFMGSDTLEGIRYANYHYDEAMSAFSIPASQHSVITAWGREGEIDAYRRVASLLGPGKTVACVSDSYDVFDVVANVWGGVLHDTVKNSGGTLVIRPDSGDPKLVVLKCLRLLEEKVGMSVNGKGYKVLPSYYRLVVCPGS